MSVVCLYSNTENKEEVVNYKNYHVYEKKIIGAFVKKIKLKYGYTNETLSQVLSIPLDVLNDLNCISYDEINRIKRLQYLLAN